MFYQHEGAMPDISMCSNNECTIKDSCYRHKAKPDSMWQSYSMFHQSPDESCIYYIPNVYVKDRENEC